jgi:hypothetical protein
MTKGDLLQLLVGGLIVGFALAIIGRIPTLKRVMGTVLALALLGASISYHRHSPVNAEMPLWGAVVIGVVPIFLTGIVMLPLLRTAESFLLQLFTGILTFVVTTMLTAVIVFVAVVYLGA